MVQSEDPFNKRKQIIFKVLQELTGEQDVQLIDGGEHADLASAIAFSLAKKQKTSPLQIAQNLVREINSSPEFQATGANAEAKGPYINFNLSNAYLIEVLQAAILPGYGNLPKKSTRVVLEHTSANPNGPLHVGHIRNSIIGDTLARAFRKAGYPLEVQYYVNDMGRQIAIVVWGFENLDSKQLDDGEKEDAHIARVYIAANREIEKDATITQQVNTLMQLVENGDPATVRKFRREVSRCLDGFRVTMKDLNVAHDRFVWESDFIRNGNTDRIISKLKRLPQAREEETLALDLSEFGFGNKYVIRRSDGTSVYAARDLAFHVWKAANFDRIIDVLGADHKLIGAQLQCTMKLLGEKVPEIVYFEFVSLPEGSMSTRAGKFVSADDLITEIRRRAFEEVTARRPELDEEVRRSIARSVGLAAVRYDIVKVSPEKSTVFDWKEALDFERQSGPYIQYAHARACSILEKAGTYAECFDLETEQEIILAKQIARFPDTLEKVISELRPHILATYSRELADKFNTFYHFEPVLKSEGKTRDRRLTLVRAAQNTLKEALETLGIDAVRSM